MVVVDEDTECCGVAAEIGQQIMEQAFDYLDGPVKRVCSRNMPIAGAAMEKYVIPQAGLGGKSNRISDGLIGDRAVRSEQQ